MANEPIIDNRPKPRIAIPKQAGTYLMAGFALFVTIIVAMSGDPDQPREVASRQASAVPPAIETLRDYEQRMQNAGLEPTPVRQPTPVTALPDPYRARRAMYADLDPVVEQAPVDPTAEERAKREYESLFSSNLISSRRQTQPAESGTDRREGRSSSSASPPIVPSFDEALQKTMQAMQPRVDPATATDCATPGSCIQTGNVTFPKPTRTPPLVDSPTHNVLLEGQFIDGVLTNRLDGSNESPVNVMVTNPVYSHNLRYELIPAGSRILGSTKPVQQQGDQRLAVSFHRLVFPNGATVSLEQYKGLNQRGDSGLHDQVNRHYAAMFGASAAIGLINGLAQAAGTAGLGGGNNRTVVVMGGIGNGTSQAASQTMNQFLNRMPTITIREGHRVKVYVTADLELPAYGR